MTYNFNCACRCGCPRQVSIGIRTDGTLHIIVYDSDGSSHGVRVQGDDLVVLAREALSARYIVNEYPQHEG